MRSLEAVAALLKQSPFIAVLLIISGLYTVIERIYKLIRGAGKAGLEVLGKADSRYRRFQLKRQLNAVVAIREKAKRSESNPSLFLLTQLEKSLMMIIGIAISGTSSILVFVNSLTSKFWLNSSLSNKFVLEPVNTLAAPPR